MAPYRRGRIISGLPVLLTRGAEALEITELRGLVAQLATGDAGPQALATKLIASEIRQGIEFIGAEAAGLDGLRLPPPGTGADERAIAAARYLDSRAWTIFGGTSEIQQDIVARAIGL